VVRASIHKNSGIFSRSSVFFSLMRQAAALVLSLAVGVVFGEAQSAPQDYPQWRGRSRDGSASEFVEPTSWPDRLTRQWVVEVGEGYSTPLVVGTTIYVFTRQNDLELLRALDASTGAERWQAGYSAPFALPPPVKAHGAGPKATPLFHRGKVYTLGITGLASAFDARTGKRVWQTSEPGEHPYFTAASSPVGYNDLVIAHPGNYDPLTAFDADTGKVRWVAGDPGAYASPMIAEFDGERQVVSVTQESVIGVSLADGRVLWRHPWKYGVNAITPVLYGDMIIVSGQNLGVTALRPRRRLGEWSAEIVWETKEVSLLLSNPVVVERILFGLSERASGQFFALDATKGKILWLGQPREATNTAIAKAGNTLFLLNDDGELIVAPANGTAFEPIKRYHVSDTGTWAQPVISGNQIFIKDRLTLTKWTVN
jgi:outer membrane protein assembly factor BamB